VRTYYAYVSAFGGWAVREGHLAENVAQRRNATEPIPDDGGHQSGDQQAWSAEDRQQLTTFVDEQANTAIDNVGENRRAAIKTCRDRALVYLLSYSGVRGAEVLRDRSDERRQGLRWEDVSLNDRYATVFAKSSVSTIGVSLNQHSIRYRCTERSSTPRAGAGRCFPRFIARPSRSG